MPSSRSLNRKDALALLALLALVLLFFWKLVFTNLIIARGDIFYYFYPYRDFAAQAVREGRVALWDPYLFMGAPFMANSQAGFFYPFNLFMSWLEVTRAINWTIVLHIFIAASGAYLFARSTLRLSILAALLSAVSFGLGGYLGTQIEHVNQLQGLAWLGWLFFAYEGTIRHPPSAIRKLKWLPLVILITLQLLAGHTQSVFITLVGLGCYALWQIIESIFATRPRGWRRYAFLITHYLLPLVFATFIAVGLSALQLLPTLELTRNSARSGGLPTNLAVSFSLDPRLLGRALLPDYEGALPAGGEFTAFFSVAALLLMTIGVTTWRRATSQTRALILVALLGLLLALGGYNPLYYLLLKVPGFDLFRAPARWIVLLAFAGSLLAGVGLDAVRDRKVSWKAVLLGVVVILLLLGLIGVSIGLTPAGASGPLDRPTPQSLLFWLGAVFITLVLVFCVLRLTHYREASPWGSLLVTSCILLLAIGELFLATRQLVYNSHATAPEALHDLRPPITYLMQAGQGATPPDRFLSISDIRFDPGDTTELQSIFADQLSKDAFYDLVVATKMKEILAPNLPLYYRVPAVDGYDGGVLPLQNYMEFQKLFLDPALIQTDGRLREQLKSIPNARWLDLMNAKYIITDKVGDQWYDGMLYDMQFTTQLRPHDAACTEQIPQLSSNALGIVYSAPGEGQPLATVKLKFADDSEKEFALENAPRSISHGLAVTRLMWSDIRQVKSVCFVGVSGLTLHGIALIDQDHDAFQSFVLSNLGEFRLVYSGDVKIYENTPVGGFKPRATMEYAVQFVKNDEEALAELNKEGYNELVLYGAPQPQYDVPGKNLPPEPKIKEYTSEYIDIDVLATADGYLFLRDAYYSGWIATVDGQSANIERADIMFRAVKVPAGQHRVEFRYQPQSFAVGAAVSIGTIIFLVALGIVLRRRNRSRVL